MGESKDAKLGNKLFGIIRKKQQRRKRGNIKKRNCKVHDVGFDSGDRRPGSWRV